MNYEDVGLLRYVYSYVRVYIQVRAGSARPFVAGIMRVVCKSIVANATRARMRARARLTVDILNGARARASIAHLGDRAQ